MDGNKQADRKAGPLTSPPITMGRWKQIGIAFIVGLPVSSKGNNCIATIYRPDGKERTMVAYV